MCEGGLLALCCRRTKAALGQQTHIIKLILSDPHRSTRWCSDEPQRDALEARLEAVGVREPAPLLFLGLPPELVGVVEAERLLDRLWCIGASMSGPQPAAARAAHSPEPPYKPPLVLVMSR